MVTYRKSWLHKSYVGIVVAKYLYIAFVSLLFKKQSFYSQAIREESYFDHCCHGPSPTRPFPYLGKYVNRHLLLSVFMNIGILKFFLVLKRSCKYKEKEIFCKIGYMGGISLSGYCVKTLSPKKKLFSSV